VGVAHLGVHGPSELTPPPPRERRLLIEEILVVLSLSLLASAVFAIIDLLSAPVAGITVAVYPNVNVAAQFASIAFGLAPAALVVHLARRSGEGLRGFGLSGDRPAPDMGWGLLLGLAVALVGVGIYVAAVKLKINRFVVPVPPLHHWWTWPVLILGSAQAAVLEEVIVVGYLIRRLLQLGAPGAAAVVASGLLRASYHLYQGWGGFAGNLTLGLLFGFLFLRWRRTWPLVVAHFSVDVLAGVAYIVFRGHCPLRICIH
jgi:membrane protease YdiL (CAAX protease family)